MAKLGRVGDPGIPRGEIRRGAETVFCNGIKVGLHVSFLGRIRRRSVYTNSSSHSLNVFAEGSPVLRSPGGSPNVNIS